MSAADAENRAARDRPLRVLHLLHTVAYGGVESVLINWLSRLDRTRAEAVLVVFANPGGTEGAFIAAAGAAGLSVLTVPWSARKPVFLAARRLTRLIKDHQIDIVHTHNVYAEVVGYLAARRARCKILTTQYVWADFGWKRNIQQAISARLIRRFNMVTSQCQMTMKETTRRGVPTGKQRVLISGFEPCHEFLRQDERTRERAALGLGQADVVLVNCARLYPEKSQALLLRAFRTILNQRPGARLWVLGVGPLEHELKALAAELGLGDKVSFLGFVPKPGRLLQLADVQVHTSSAEGVPLALCEGMAVGLPVVATAVGGVPEMIAHERSGILIPAGDERSLVEQCIRLIDDPVLRTRLGAGARSFIETEYTFTVALDHLAAAYEEIMR